MNMNPNNFNDSFSSNNSFNQSQREDTYKNNLYFHSLGESQITINNGERINNSFSNTENLKVRKYSTNTLGNKKSSSLFVSCIDKDEKVEEFKDLDDLLKNIDCEFWIYAKTQKGSRNLQKLLNKILPDELDHILEKIKENFYELMTDTYGNYFCQKLIQCCSSEQRVFILRNVKLILYILIKLSKLKIPIFLLLIFIFKMKGTIWEIIININ